MELYHVAAFRNAAANALRFTFKYVQIRRRDTLIFLNHHVARAEKAQALAERDMHVQRNGCFRAFCLLESAFQVGWAEPVVPNGRRRVTGVARAGTIVFCEKLFADAKFVAHLLKRWIGERHRKWPHRDCAAGRISPSNACWPVSTKS